MSLVPLVLLLILFLVVWVKKPDLPVSSSKPPVSYKSQKGKWTVAFFVMVFSAIVLLYMKELSQGVALMLK